MLFSNGMLISRVQEGIQFFGCTRMEIQVYVQLTYFSMACEGNIKQKKIVSIRIQAGHREKCIFERFGADPVELVNALVI